MPICLDMPPAICDDDAMIINDRTALDFIRAIESLDDDDTSLLIRDLLIDDSTIDPDLDSPLAQTMRDAIRLLDTHTLSLMRLDYSLCPLHAIDYAICFDDDDADCATIRSCFPNHDT